MTDAQKTRTSYYRYSTKVAEEINSYFEREIELLPVMTAYLETSGLLYGLCENRDGVIREPHLLKKSLDRLTNVMVNGISYLPEDVIIELTNFVTAVDEILMVKDE